MANMDDRMELIGSAILEQAHREARELTDKANDIHDKEISEFKNEIMDEMFGKMQARSNGLRQASTKKIAKLQLVAHKTLLSHRAEQADYVLNAVREKLSDYAKTPQYKDDVLKRAAELTSSYDHSCSVILVSEKALPLGEEIKKILGGGTIKTDTSIALGGFKLRNEKARVLLDETLDERLEEQKLWLLENCGLKVL